MRILVTGGCGFIGSNLVKRLLEEGHDVTSLDNYSSGSANNHHKGANYIFGSTKNIFELVHDVPDVIFHLGEYSRVEQSFDDVEKVIDYNRIGTARVVEYTRLNNCKLIYAGSSTKFGDNGDNADASPYAWSKSSNVQMINNYGKWFNLDYAIVYFYNVYGAGEMGTGKLATLIGIFKNKIKNNQQLKVVSPGTQQRNFTHIDDTVDALMLVLRNGTGDGYGIASPKAYSILEVAEMFSPEEPIEMLPERAGNRMIADIIDIKTRELGWIPTRDLETHINEFSKNL